MVSDRGANCLIARWLFDSFLGSSLVADDWANIFGLRDTRPRSSEQPERTKCLAHVVHGLCVVPPRRRGQVPSDGHRVLVPVHGHRRRRDSLDVRARIFLWGAAAPHGAVRHRNVAVRRLPLSGKTWLDPLQRAFRLIGFPLLFSRQMLDMIKPVKRDCITLTDLKRCKMTPIFFDTFFNLEKYMEHEQRDPFAQKESEDVSETGGKIINSCKICANIFSCRTGIVMPPKNTNCWWLRRATMAPGNYFSIYHPLHHRPHEYTISILNVPGTFPSPHHKAAVDGFPRVFIWFSAPDVVPPVKIVQNFWIFFPFLMKILSSLSLSSHLALSSWIGEGRIAFKHPHTCHTVPSLITPPPFAKIILSLNLNSKQKILKFFFHK